MSPQDWPTYHYRAKLARVTDGDTIRVLVDMGMYVQRQVSIRIADIDTPEVYGRDASPEGTLAAEALESLIEGRTLYIATKKDKKSFDRYVATVYMEDDDGAWINVADRMVDMGWAVRV